LGRYLYAQRGAKENIQTLTARSAFLNLSADMSDTF
jgi:hypothetical protein